MSLLSNLHRRARATARRLAHNVRAAVLLEMAFAIPFLVLVGFGGLEIANLTLTHTRISQLALNTADNAARIAAGSNLTLPEIREVDINEVFAGAERQAASLNLRSNGRIILSSLERNATNGQTIKWQRCFGDMRVPSAFGVEGTGKNDNNFQGMGPVGREVKAAAGTAVMFVEITYEYQPLLYGKVLGDRTIHTTAAYNVREARDLSGVKAPGTKASCT
ncbi:hypothetical protein SAMN05428974_1898 [Sphingopyxis sp. YR583]|uniref:TadE/TadG family type IV pilus assembly protein n=1 Tax=Sphingopyxis sp. YR583 TaxID=1881047 RepID=UPI0008A735D9|nr:hypothetical protein [Sphingopyxis sp. YR583]SEH16777.1 hypothetical protein SAMN05428974_1898 [Sphingopyxis sp. YR583]